MSLEHLETRLAPAVTYTWTGGSPINTNWSNPANWSGGTTAAPAPTGLAANNEDLVFPTLPLGAPAASYLTHNNLSGGVFHSITISGSGYTLGGNALTLGDPTSPGSGFVIVGPGAAGEILSMDVRLNAGSGGSNFRVDAGADLTLSGRLSGSASALLTKDLTGVLTLTNNNSTYFGAVTLNTNGGIVAITNPNALGDGSNTTTVGPNAQLQLKNVAGTINESLKLNGPGFSNDGALDSVSGKNTWAGGITLDSNATLGAAAGVLTISGQITDLGAGHGVTKVGAGEIIFSHANTYRGSTTINNGVLDIQDPDALGNSATFANTAIVNSSPTTGSATLQIDDPTGVGFTVPNETVTLNGAGFGGVGSLFNLNGDNVWAGDIVLGSTPPNGSNVSIGVMDQTSLTVSGTGVNAQGVPLPAVSSDSAGASFSLTKIGEGKLIFTTPNTYISPTTVAAGVLEIEDSQALGAGSAPTTVNSGASLELAVDQLPDSLTGNTTALFVSTPSALNLTGKGFQNEGALWSHSGINTWAQSITLVGAEASIGVDPASNPTTTQYDVTPDGKVLDESLSVTGNITGGSRASPVQLDKFLAGQLILPNANSYQGPTNIQQGWVTIENVQALGQRIFGLGDAVEPPVTVNVGAALHLLPLSGNLILPYNLILSGSGITSGYGLINQQGALMNLSGINTVKGNINLMGQVGIGVEKVFSSDPADPTFSTNAASQLTLAGSQSETKGVLNISATSSGGSAEDDNIVNVGSTHGTLTIDFDAFSIPDDLRVYYGPVGTPGSTLLYDSSTNGDAQNPTTSMEATITINFSATNSSAVANPNVGSDGDTPGLGYVLGPVNKTYGPLTSTQIEIIINQGGASDQNQGTFWTYSATLTGGTNNGGITKLGSQRLIIQGDGTYTGPVDIQQGVLLNQNDTGLGAGGTATSTATVEAGSALELANSSAPDAGGTVAGIQVAGEHLILNGTGNPAFNDAALTVLSNNAGPAAPVNDPLTSTDDLWRGPVTLNNAATLSVPSDSRLSFFGVVDDAPNASVSGSDLTLTGGGELFLSAANTYRGVTYVQQGVLTIGNGQALGGAGIAEVDTLTLGNATANLTAFTLTFDGFTTAPIPYHANASDAAAIQAALTGLASVAGAADVAGSATVTRTSPNVFAITFGGSLTGFAHQLTATVTSSDHVTATAAVAQTIAGAGGTVVSAGATIQLAGGITVAGEPLIIQGQGGPTTPSTPLRWFSAGPAPVLNGQTAGKGNVSGRVTGVAVDPTDPNTIYISTAGGGAWKTINGGKTWLPLFDSQVAGSVLYSGAIAVSPSDPRVIYLGTGEADNSGDSFYGTGVYRSLDSGHTWTLLTSNGVNPLFGQAVSKIVVDPNDPTLIYVASSDQAVNVPGNVGTPGVWRYMNGKWFDLTAVVSTNRATQKGQLAAPPNTPGPDDDYRYRFPQQNATWSDVALIYTDISNTGGRPPQPVLYIALGISAGNVNNAVYWSENPTSNNPIWYVGSPGGTNLVPASPPPSPDARSGNEFPAGNFVTGSPLNGNIKITAVAGTILNNTTLYAAVTNPTTNALRTILKSTDGAQDWAAVATAPPNYLGTQGDYDNTIVAASATTVYVGGQESSTATHATHVLVTTNGGSNWTDISVDGAGNGPHTDDHAMAIDANGRLIDGNDGGVWRLDPANGNAWTDINGNLATITFNSVAPNPTDPNKAIGGSQDNGVEIYNGSPGWAFADFGDGGQVAINPSNPSIVYHVVNGTLAKSVSGGVLGSWSTILNVPFTLYFPFVLDGVNTSRLLVGGVFPGIQLQESLNAGSSWTDLRSPIDVTALGIATFQGAFQADPGFSQVGDVGANTYDPDTIYVSDGSRVEVTKNHGVTWQNRTTDLPGITIQSLTVDPRNRDTVFVVGSDAPGAGLGRVFMTTTAGLPLNGNPGWDDITGDLPDIPVWKLVVDPRNGNLYVGTDDGVYLSTNLGQHWQRFGAGMPHVQVQDLELNQSLNTLTAGTYGRSMFQLFLDDVQGNSGALRAVSGSSVWTGPVVFAGPATIAANGLSAAQLNLVGTISDLTANGNYQFTKIGQGNVVLSGANVYGGLTDVKEGVLTVANPNSLGQSGPAAGTNVEAGAALGLQSDLAVEPITLNGDGVPFNGHNTGALHNISGNNTYTGVLTLNSDATIGVDSGSSLTIGSKPPLPGAGTILDNGNGYNLVKEGPGTLVLADADAYGGGAFSLPDDPNTPSFAGGTVVAQGVLDIRNAGALGNGGNTTTVLDGAQLQVENSLVVQNQNLRLSGTGIFGAGALLSLSGVNKWEGAVTLAKDAGFSPSTTPPAAVSISVLGAYPTNSLTLDGAVTQAAGTTLGLTKIGPALLVLNNNASSYGGVTTVSAGALRIQKSNALGTAGGLGGGAVVQSGAALQLDGGGAGLTVPAIEALTLNGTGIGNGGALEDLSGNDTWGGAITLQSDSALGADAGTVLTLSGVIQDPTPAPTPPANLTKFGAGKVILTSDNTFTGNTAVTAGTLLADGPNPGNTLGPVFLSGATLGGTGTVGAITDAPSTLQPGDSNTLPGTLTSGTVTLSNSTTFFVSLNPNGDGKSDLLAVNGDLALNGATLSGFVGPTVQPGDSFTIVTFTGNLTGGHFAEPVAPNLVYFGGGKFSVTYNAHSIVLQKVLESASMGITSSANPSVYGQSVTFTATVRAVPPDQGTPGGSVTFYIDGTPQASSSPLTNGQATLTLNNLSFGSHAISASYSGDNSFSAIAFNPAAPPRLTQTVNQAKTTTKVTAAPSSGDMFGQSVTFTATVANTVAGGLAPSAGTVTFTDGALSLGMGTFVSPGVWTLSTAALPVGANQTITAVYSGTTAGGSNFAGSTGTLANYSVAKAGTSTSMTAAPSSGDVFGQTVMLTATVTVSGVSVAPLDGGSVSFYFGTPSAATLLGTANVSTGSGTGTASITTVNTALPVGANQTLTAIYTGTTTIAGSTGTLANYSVAQANTTTTVSAAPTSGDVYGQTVTFTATVTANSPSTAAVNTGKVTFTDGALTLGMGTFVSPGVWTLSTSALPAGANQTITATYSDASASPANFAGSAGTLTNYSVAQATSSTVISSVFNPSGFNQPVTFTATVSDTSAGSSAIPNSGTVTFTFGAQTLGGGPVNVTNGTATVTVSNLPLGADQINAVYSGDPASFSGSTAATYTQVVAHPTAVTITPASAAVVTGQTATFMAHVASTDGSGTPTSGTLTLFANGTQNGAAQPVSGSGDATFNLNNLPFGTYSITVQFSGASPTFGGSTSATPSSLTVSKASTTTTLVSNVPFPLFGQPASFTATVHVASPGAGSPGGTVSFYVDGSGTAAATLGLSSGQATFFPTNLPVGPHTVLAVYNGDINFKASPASAPAGATVVATTSTAVTSSAGVTFFGQNETFTATVSSASVANPGIHPTGSVYFFIDGVYYSTQPLNAGGQASYTLNFLPVGTHTVFAYYGGDATFYFPSQSPTVTGDHVVANGAPALVSSAVTTLYGTYVTMTATVGAGVPGVRPTGSVYFFFDGTYYATVGLNANGQASYSLNFLPVGTHYGVAYYAGDNNYTAALSPIIVADTVTAFSMTSLFSSVSNPVAGQTITFTAAVGQTAPGVKPTGFVSFYIDNVLYANVNLNANGQASFAVALAKGNHSVVAVYSGDPDYIFSFASLTQVVFDSGRRT